MKESTDTICDKSGIQRHDVTCQRAVLDQTLLGLVLQPFHTTPSEPIEPSALGLSSILDSHVTSARMSNVTRLSIHPYKYSITCA